MAPRITEKSRALVELPMLIFLRIADSDGKMTVREMERFDQLIAKREWCRSRLLERALLQTGAEKAELWKRYASGDLKAGSDTVVAVLDTVLNGLPPGELEPMRADLARFGKEITKAADAEAGFFQNDDEARKAFAELNARLARTVSVREPEIAVATSPALTLNRPATVAPHLAENIAEERMWRTGKLKLRCVQIVDETHDVKTFRFVAIPAKLFVYKPGQFMTLEVQVEGQIIRRSYTISASPSRPLVISVTVKRVTGGTISNWLHDNLKVGDMLFADGPHGKFSCIDDENDKFLFISGGSGVTPVMSMSRWLADTSHGADMRFLHFARSPIDLIFEHELRMMAHNTPTSSRSSLSAGLSRERNGAAAPGAFAPRCLLKPALICTHDRSMFVVRHRSWRRRRSSSKVWASTWSGSISRASAACRVTRSWRLLMPTWCPR